MHADPAYESLLDKLFDCLGDVDLKGVDSLGDPEGWRLFVSANRWKRAEKIIGRLPGLARHMPELAQHARDYVRAMFQPAGEDLTQDTEKFLCWLEGHVTLLPQHRDEVSLHRARTRLIDRSGPLAAQYHAFMVNAHESADRALTDTDVLAVNPLRERIELQAIRVGEPVPVILFPFAREFRGRALSRAPDRLLTAIEHAPSLSWPAIAQWLGIDRRSARTSLIQLIECGLAAIDGPGTCLGS